MIPDYVSTQSSGHAVTLNGTRTENDTKWVLSQNTNSSAARSTSPGGGRGCGQGRAPDLMTGQCANLCSNGLPEIGALCLPGW